MLLRMRVYCSSILCFYILAIGTINAFFVTRILYLFDLFVVLLKYEHMYSAYFSNFVYWFMLINQKTQLLCIFRRCYAACKMLIQSILVLMTIKC